MFISLSLWMACHSQWRLKCYPRHNSRTIGHTAYLSFVFILNNWEDISPFWGATDTPVLNFWRHLPWVSKPGWTPHLRAFLAACNGFLRITSGATPAGLLMASIVAKPFLTHWRLTCSMDRHEWGQHPVYVDSVRCRTLKCDLLEMN